MFNISLVISVASLKVACLFEDSDHVLRFPFTRDVINCKGFLEIQDGDQKEGVRSKFQI